jgi:hypothetical protein
VAELKILGPLIFPFSREFSDLKFWRPLHLAVIVVSFAPLDIIE